MEINDGFGFWLSVESKKRAVQTALFLMDSSKPDLFLYQDIFRRSRDQRGQRCSQAEPEIFTDIREAQFPYFRFRGIAANGG